MFVAYASAMSLQDWAKMLAANWEARSRRPTRDLFVASHAGWQDPAAWDRHARVELELFLSNLDAAWLRDAEVLEIGCGSGRLIPFLRPQVRSYTGFDIATGMVEAAQQRAAGLDGVRLFVGDGLSVPVGARDRQYRLVLAVAVFIHCPREVIAANVQSAWQQLAPGGQLRIQVLADPTDPTGIAVPATTAAAANDAGEQDARASLAMLSADDLKLVRDTYYMGHQFRFAEVEPFLRELTGGRVALYRGDLAAIYALIEKSEAAAAPPRAV